MGLYTGGAILGGAYMTPYTNYLTRHKVHVITVVFNKKNTRSGN